MLSRSFPIPRETNPKAGIIVIIDVLTMQAARDTVSTINRNLVRAGVPYHKVANATEVLLPEHYPDLRQLPPKDPRKIDNPWSELLLADLSELTERELIRTPIRDRSTTIFTTPKFESAAELCRRICSSLHTQVATLAGYVYPTVDQEETFRLASKRDYYQREEEVYDATRSNKAIAHIRGFDSAHRRLSSFMTDEGGLVQTVFSLCSDDKRWDNLSAWSYERQNSFVDKWCFLNTEAMREGESPFSTLKSIGLVGLVQGVNYCQTGEVVLLIKFFGGQTYDVIAYQDGFRNGFRPEQLVEHCIRFAGIPVIVHGRNSIIAYKILDRKAASSRFGSNESEGWQRFLEEASKNRTPVRRGDPAEVSRMEEYIEKRSPLVNELAQTFQTHWNRPTPQRIGEWLLQFNNTAEIAIALKILQHILYVDDGKVLDIFREFYDKLNIPSDSQLALTILGPLNESAGQVVSKCSKALMESEQQKISFQPLRDTMYSLDPRRTTLVLVDDNIASGIQATQMWEELLAKVSRKNTREYVRTPLTTREIEWLRNCQSVISFSLVGMEDGEHSLERTAHQYGIKLQAYSSVPVERLAGCFTPRSLIWNDRTERQMAMEVAFEIGYEILGEKNWGETKRRERALGYGGLQRLLVFSHSTPKSTLPILWKKGPYRGKSWEPLFPSLP